MVRLSATAFRAALQHPAVANAMLGRLANLVRSLSDRVFEFSTLSVRHRLHAELLRLAREEGINNNGRITIPQSPKHAELADRLSTHREAVSREMSALTRARIIERSNDALVIRDLDRLTQLLADETGG
jgi:CRP-like cAMP-binding protein